MMSPDRIFQTGLGFWASKTLLSAVELEVFTKLETHPGTLDAVTEELGLHPRGARDFLDALVALGFLERTDGIYRNGPEAALFLDKTKATYIGGLLEMANARLYRYWDRLTDALRTGQPQNEARDGHDVFAAIYADPAALRQFLTAMSAVSRGANEAIAAKFPWDRVRTCADIGAAQGDLLTRILLAHPHLTGVGFDLPAVEPVFAEYVADHGLAGRVAFQPGNFFQADLPSADVLLFGHILHDWDLDTKKMLLRKAHVALPSGGAVILYDALIDDERRQNAFGLLMSLNMLIETSSGFDYSGADGISWLEEAGFRGARVEPLVGPDSMIVAYKP